MEKWQLIKLGDLITHKKGFAFKSSSYVDEGILVVRVSDTTNTSIDLSTCKKVSDDFAIQYKDYELLENDIVIMTVGSWPDNPKSVVGKVIKVPLAANNALLNQNAVRIRSRNQINQDYLYFRLKDRTFSGYIVNNAQGSANQASITLDDIFSFELNLPPLPEQRAIASVLSSLDDKINLLHRQNKTLEAMAETLFKQWFVEEAHEGREEIPLGDIATVQNGYAFSSRDYVEHHIDHLEVFKMGHIEPGGGLRYFPKTDFVPRAEKLEKWILSEGDIVMAMTDMKDSMGILGHPAMIDKSDTYVLNQRVARIYLNNNESLINNHFLYFQLKTDDAIAIIQSKSHGGVQVNLSTEAIRSTPVIVPSEPDQVKGFKLLEGYLLKSQNNRKQIRTLEKLRDMLLPKLMSGEVRVQLDQREVAI